MRVRPKETTPNDPNEGDALAHDISVTIDFAEQACDGYQLSDEELDELCDAVLVEDASDRERLETKP